MSTPDLETEIIDLKILIEKLKSKLQDLEAKLKNRDLKIQDLEAQLEKSNRVTDALKKGRNPTFKPAWKGPIQSRSDNMI